MQIYEELATKGLIAQVINEGEIKETINKGKAVPYIGFDPTVDSLHVGHFMVLCLMKRPQMAGSKPTALIGGGTGMIGNPPGHSDMRTMMASEIIRHSCDCFKKQMSRSIGFLEGKTMMVNNAGWLMDPDYIESPREVGPHFSVNSTLRIEYCKQRMEKGLDFLKFSYMTVQSYDFYELSERYGCNMQFGGDSQWSNILGGAELTRRKLDKDAHATTVILLLNSEGEKMGETQSGVVWLNPEKTSPFDFYQYWRNVGDSDMSKRLHVPTSLPLEQIDEVDKWEGSQLNQTREILAFGLAKLVHGEEETSKAQEGARALFAVGVNAGNMPAFELTEEGFPEGTVDILSILNKSDLVVSCSEVRRNMEQGGVSVDRNPAKDIRTVYSREQFEDGMIVKRDKKNSKRTVSK